MSETIALGVNGLTWRKITDQIVSALEGGSGYWMQSFKPEGSDIETKVSPWYDDENIWSGNFNIRVEVYEDDVVMFTPEKIHSGLKYLADNHLWRIEQMIKESGDAETGDVFIQACLFGDIVYG
jgi:hypothetical protein